MELKEIQKMQKEFDLQYFPNFWKFSNDKEFIERLKYCVVALTGELGELANLLKKIEREIMHIRQDIDKEKIEEIKEELIDVFIYTVIMANLLNVDLEQGYLAKNSKLKERFKHFKEANQKH